MRQVISRRSRAASAVLVLAVMLLSRSAFSREMPTKLPHDRELVGQVLNERGEPVAGASIILEHESGGPENTRADGRGNFRFKYSWRETISVSAYDAKHRLTAIAHLSLPSTTKLVIRLHAYPTVVVTVLRPAGPFSGPVEGATVSVPLEKLGPTPDGATEPSSERSPDHSEGPAAQQIRTLRRSTDANGIVRFESVSTGRLRVRVTAPGFIGVEEEFLIYPDVERSVTISLYDGVILHGRVVDEQQRPVAGATVHANTWQFSYPNPIPLTWIDVPRMQRLLPDELSTLSGEDGGFELGPVPRRSQRLQASLGNAHSDELRVGESDYRSTIVLVLSPDTQIRGELVGSRGSTIEHVTINSEEVGAPNGKFSIRVPKFQKKLSIEGPFENVILDLPSRTGDLDLGTIAVKEGECLDGQVIRSTCGPVQARIHCERDAGDKVDTRAGLGQALDFETGANGTFRSCGFAVAAVTCWATSTGDGKRHGPERKIQILPGRNTVQLEAEP